MGGRLSVFICALVATLVIGIGTPGSANVINRSDGNDTKGPLDLARLKVAHAGGAHVFQLTTIGSFSNKDANGTHELRTDYTIVRYPDRYRDKRGAEIWDYVTKHLAERQQVVGERLAG